MARPIAPRLDLTVLANKSGTDSTQVLPPAGTMVYVYRAGATVSADVTIPAFQEVPVPVNVYDAGQLALNDFVRAGATAGRGLLVVGGVSPTQVLLSSNMSTAVFLGV